MYTLVIVLFAITMQAPEPQLAALRSTIVPLREHANDNREIRGATKELTTAKHQLRDWIESRLAKFAQDGEQGALAEELHAGVRDSQLFCDDDKECFPSYLGYLDEIQVNREGEFLIVETAVGIWCGFDYSAYVYKWNGGRWQRIWENEQNTYTETKYLPQIIHAVQISSPDANGNRLLMTLGARPGCSAAFQPVYFRVWPMNARNEVQSAPVLDAAEMVSAVDPPIEGRLKPDDVLLTFTVGGTGYGESHKAVRHFEVRGGRARQVDPIAVTPRDFVEEWLGASWTQSAGRSESASLKPWHAKLHRDDGQGDFPDPAMRCTGSSDLWQIGTHLHDAPKTYYLVRWRKPYSFAMVGVSGNPYPDCTIADPKGDEQPAILTQF